MDNYEHPASGGKTKLFLILGQIYRIINTAKPPWRNWHTRTTQNRMTLRSCGFNSHRRHHRLACPPLEGTIF